MNPDVVLTVLYFTLAACAGLGVGWVRATKRARRLERIVEAQLLGEERLQALERSVDALVTRCDRVIDYQDALAKRLEP